MHLLTIGEAARLIESRRLSPVDLTQALLARISRYDSQINSFVTITGERALRQAKRAEADISAGRYRGPLHGIPFGLKDVIDTAGVLTSAHSRICGDNYPLRDAAVVSRLADAGSLLLGKLATHEFAHGGPSFDLPWPPARNPWDTARFTGGSSSGSAAAVASGFIPAALGTDTGGSIRIPAGLCGVTGLKPTYGLVSRRGIIPNSYSFDHCGPIAWTAEDCAIVLDAIAGFDAEDPASASHPPPQCRRGLRKNIRGARIGVIRHFWEEDLVVQPAVARAMADAIRVFVSLGAHVETVRLRPLQQYTDVKNLISETELFCVHQHDLANRAAEYGTIMRSRIFAFCLFQAADYVQAQRQRRRMIEEMQDVYRNFDLLLTAGPGPAPRLDAHRAIGLHEKWEKPKLSAAFSVTGGPALVLCSGFDDGELPLAMEIAGRPFSEQVVLQAGYAYQQATGWPFRRPQLVEDTRTPEIALTTEESQDPPELDESTRFYVDMMARRAGLKLTPSQKKQLYEAAPYALAMAERIARDHAWSDEPANVFRFPE